MHIRDTAVYPGALRVLCVSETAKACLMRMKEGVGVVKLTTKAEILR